MGGRPGRFAIVYLGRESPSEWTVSVPLAFSKKKVTVKAEIIDAWGMTISPVEGSFELQPTSTYKLTCPSRPSIPLPGRPMQAIRLVALSEGS